MIYRIDIFSKKETAYKDLVHQLILAGAPSPFGLRLRRVYLLEAELSESDVYRIATQLLVDPIVEDFHIYKGMFNVAPSEFELLVTYNPGVTDPAALSLEKAIRDMGLTVVSCRCARFYAFEGLPAEILGGLAAKVLFNPLIEHIVSYEKMRSADTLEEFSGRDYAFTRITIDMRNADDDRLMQISQQGCLSLTLDEMRIIREYFEKKQRNPTDCELETIAALWSEHCSHKTFRGIIEYQEKDASGAVVSQEVIDHLLKATVMKATKDIKHPGCVSVFHDNSGVVTFDDANTICYKVETHNHPSSLEPYGGASTGIGGVIRDVLGTGCAAKPFASIDVFCFAPWQMPYDQLPKGLLHPGRIIRGVVGGVRDYGNRMGIPTVAGAVLFDERFLSNPLVYCGTLGIMPKEKAYKKVEPGDVVIVAGARTGRDGIHGATFSSKELDKDTIQLTSAVQIGNAIEEKKLVEAVLRARDAHLFDAITDCGAGGISSAITEIAADHGVEVNLEAVPLKYRGLSYTEIWISESQERMVLTAKPDCVAGLKALFDEEDVDMTVVGTVTGDHMLRLLYAGALVCELDMDFIFTLPKLAKKAVWTIPLQADIKVKGKKQYTQDLMRLLADPDIAPKDWIVRQYDHEVQAGSVNKAIYGNAHIAVSDAAIVRPDLASIRAVALGFGINPRYSDIDPYWMAALAIDEALRNVVASGGNPKATYILDNFCWGSPQDPQVLGGLVRAARACYDWAVYYGVPFISGKDSLYNEYSVDGKKIAIPGTLLISAVSVMDDWHTAVPNSFRGADNLIYVIGVTKAEMGGSHYFKHRGLTGGIVPKIEKEYAADILMKLHLAIQAGLAASCHDISEGGLAVALAEMCMGQGLGAEVFLAECKTSGAVQDYEILFSQSPTRFFVEVSARHKIEFEKIMAGVPWGLVGCVCDSSCMRIYNKTGVLAVDAGIPRMRQSWMNAFKDFRV